MSTSYNFGCVAVAVLCFILVVSILIFVVLTAGDTGPVATPPTRVVLQFFEHIGAAGVAGPVTDAVPVRFGDTWRLDITVNKEWDTMPHGDRIRALRVYRGTWRGLLPVMPGGNRASVAVLDASGVVIGEATYTESAYWVK